MLSVKALSAGYGRISVLSDINLTVKEGEMVALVGTNGSGKRYSSANYLRPRASAGGKDLFSWRGDYRVSA